MINSFDADIAMEVGMAAAVLYRNIQYWCEKNRTNGMHEHEGLFWTYNSTKAYCEQFPYMNAKQIRKALADLEERGYIKSGNFNENGRDRTKWYADLCPNKNNIEVPKSEDCIIQNGTMHEPDKEIPLSQSGKPLPNNYQITTTNNNKERKKAESTRATFDEILDSYEVIKNSPELRDAWVGFIQMRQRIRAPLTDRALELNIKKAFELAKDDPAKVLKIVNNSIAKGYRGVFPDEDRSQSGDQSDNPYTKMLKERGLA
jgi:hypothetical protein